MGKSKSGIWARYYPWRIFRRYFIGLFAFSLLVLLGLAWFFRQWVLLRWPEANADLDAFLFPLTLVFALSAVAIQALALHGLLSPLFRIKTRLNSRAADRGVDAFLDQPKEWHEIERALEQMRKNIEAQGALLDREREEMSALLSSANDAILAVRRSGEFLYFNTQFALLFGLKGSRVDSHRLQDTFRSPDILRSFSQAIETAQAQRLHVDLHTATHENDRSFVVSWAPLFDKDTAYGAVAVFHDITEFKQTEQIRMEFVANASHELRTPLTVIKGYLQAIDDESRNGDAGKIREFIPSVARNVDRMIMLVNDLLDLSVLESNSSLIKDEINLQILTNNVLSQLEVKRAQKNHSIKTTIEVDILKGNFQRIEQVLINLIHNAIKYTPDGGLIEVSWRLAKDGIELRVRDNGPGIPNEHLPRIFERFYRVDAGRSRDMGGTGLGLSIVKHIMLNHGGTVKAASAPGRGSEFICLFPV